MSSPIRNFCIIAHIDHGKSTLADRFLELTKTIEPRRMREQFLDQMELERERGITIKLQPVRMHYQYSGNALNPKSEILNPKRDLNSKSLEFSARGGSAFGGSASDLELADSEYILNLIDTPGHVDFSYEVSRSLAAVEGAILLVDATQGIEAQTLAHLKLAQEQGLVIIPVINKIDLPTAEPSRVKKEISQLLQIQEEEILMASARQGTGVREVLGAVVERIPPPSGQTGKPLRALIFDARFDSYRGVVAYVRVVDGEVRAGDQILALGKGGTSKVIEAGYFSPELKKTGELKAGEIGYLVTGFKDLRQARVGDTLVLASQADRAQSLPGYQPLSPLVYASLFPQDRDDYGKLREALGQLQLSDASLVFEPDTSEALGFGFRCGFLGLLHLEIIKERIRREFGLELVVAAPSVRFRVRLKNGKEFLVNRPADLPDMSQVVETQEPEAHLEVLTPPSFIGAITELVRSRGGILQETQTLNTQKSLLIFQAPLRSLIVNFHDQLKSATAGLASESFFEIGYQTTDLVKLEIQANGETIDPFTCLVTKKEASSRARRMLASLKGLVPRQLFVVVLQAVVAGRVVAREEIPALRKDVLARLYGGDRTRKDKLLEKQKRGKKKMKEKGRAEIPPEAFQKLLGI